jgi:amidohydrolase
MLADKEILLPLIEEAAAKAVEIRRDLHMHPELSGQEIRTSGIIAAVLKELGIETREGLGKPVLPDPEYIKAVLTSTITKDMLKDMGMGEEVLGGIDLSGLDIGSMDPATIAAMASMIMPPGHGVLGTIYGEDPTRAIAIRADIDALPVTEETDTPFKSQNPGVMHACGHDMHTAALLGTAMVLKKYADRGGRLPRSVKFIFQPNEEGTGGAAPMIAEGVMQDPAVESIFAFHVDPSKEYGKIRFFPGVMNASCTDFKITVHGKASHGAHPNLGIDPIPCACDTVLALQTIITRKLDPSSGAVLTVGAIRGGSTTNQVPEQCEMVGTIRTLDNESLRIIEDEMRRLVSSVAEGYGCTAETVIGELYPVLFNDPEVSEVIRTVAEDLVGPENIVNDNAPSFSSDDFAYFTSAVKGCYFHLGSTRPGSEEIHDIHSNLFDPDERLIRLAIAMEVFSCLRLMGA